MCKSFHPPREERGRWADAENRTVLLVAWWPTSPQGYLCGLAPEITELQGFAMQEATVIRSQIGTRIAPAISRR
jgi:hypothetical protein